MQQVLNKGFAMVARQCRPFLGAVLAAAVVLGAVALTLHDGRWFLFSTTIVGLAVGLLVLGLVAAVRHLPVTLGRSG